MAAVPMLAGVGLMMVCCSSSSAMMMMGGEEKEDPVVPKTLVKKKTSEQKKADEAKAKADKLKADPDATPADVAAAQMEADNAQAAADDVDDDVDETFTVPVDAVSTAECYGARYWDLRAAFGTNNAALASHSGRSAPGGPESRDLTCNISDAEAQCYLDRYPAVQAYAGTNLKLARKHYYEVGMGENKDFVCPPGVTELQCYGERYPDLQNAFGTDYAARGTVKTIYKLGQHYAGFGKGEGRDFSCP